MRWPDRDEVAHSATSSARKSLTCTNEVHEVNEVARGGAATGLPGGRSDTPRRTHSAGPSPAPPASPGAAAAAAVAGSTRYGPALAGTAYSAAASACRAAAAVNPAYATGHSGAIRAATAAARGRSSPWRTVAVQAAVAMSSGTSR